MDPLQEVRQGTGEMCSNAYLAQGAGGAPPHGAEVRQALQAHGGADAQARARAHAHDGQVDDEAEGARPHEGHGDPDLDPAGLLADCTRRQGCWRTTHMDVFQHLPHRGWPYPN